MPKPPQPTSLAKRPVRLSKKIWRPYIIHRYRELQDLRGFVRWMDPSVSTVAPNEIALPILLRDPTSATSELALAGPKNEQIDVIGVVS